MEVSFHNPIKYKKTFNLMWVHHSQIGRGN